MIHSRTRSEVRSHYNLTFYPGTSTLGAPSPQLRGPTTFWNPFVVAFACFCGGSVLPITKLSACVHRYERPVLSSPRFSPGFYLHMPILLGHSSKILSKTRPFRFSILLAHALICVSPQNPLSIETRVDFTAYRWD